MKTIPWQDLAAVIERAKTRDPWSKRQLDRWYAANPPPDTEKSSSTDERWRAWIEKFKERHSSPAMPLPKTPATPPAPYQEREPGEDDDGQT